VLASAPQDAPSGAGSGGAMATSLAAALQHGVWRQSAGA
jgi:hypothetical protein